MTTLTLEGVGLSVVAESGGLYQEQEGGDIRIKAIVYTTPQGTEAGVCTIDNGRTHQAVVRTIHLGLKGAPSNGTIRLGPDDYDFSLTP